MLQFRGDLALNGLGVKLLRVFTRVSACVAGAGEGEGSVEHKVGWSAQRRGQESWRK